MPVFVNIPLYLEIAGISQYLSQADFANQNAFKGGALNNNYTRLLRAVRLAVKWAYNRNPNDLTTEPTAIYMYQLCGKYVQQAINIINNQAAGLATITGPSNQSILVGQSASFTIVVTSSTSYTIEWFRNGVLIPGAISLTYTLINAQLTDTGAQFSAVVTNGAGPMSSGTGVLTVAASLVGYYYQGSTDYSTLLLAGTDSVAYLGTFPITTGQPLTVTFPDLVSTEYIVVKYPATETTKTTYLNPPPSGPDSGTIPSLSLEANTFGGWKYIFSRTGNTFGLNNVNGQVKFS